MKQLPGHAASVLLSLALAALLAGCIVSEEDDLTVILNEDGKSGTATVVKFNVQSDERDPAKQQEDFAELMKAWKSDEYLLEKTKEGVYVKDRQLSTKGGRLVWSETSLFADLATLFAKDVAADTLRLSLGKADSVVATNGIVVRTADTTRVSWPAKARTLRLRVRHNDFQPTSDFAAEFRRRARK